MEIGCKYCGNPKFAGLCEHCKKPRVSGTPEFDGSVSNYTDDEAMCAGVYKNLSEYQISLPENSRLVSAWEIGRELAKQNM